MEIICSTLGYCKAQKLIHALESVEDEEQQEQMDFRFDFWTSVTMLSSSVFMFLGLVVLGFLSHANSRLNQAWMLIPFLVLVLSSAGYQIAVVKQIQSKDPMKKGDPADFSFHRKWLASCDEAEREIAYQASYKTFMLMQIVIMVATLLALLGELYYATGVFAIMLMGGLYVLMNIAYVIYSLRIQKSKINLIK